MADTEATPKESVNLTDNPSAWFDKKDAERTDKTDAPSEGAKVDSAASPAEPTVADPKPETQPAPSWKDTVIGDDVDHGFFRGKKVPQVIESYRHAELAKQNAERKAAELERQLAQMQQAQKPAPSVDPEINRLWFENPEAAYRMLEERAKAEAARVADERFQQNWEVQSRNQQIAHTFEEGSKAYDAARAELKLDPDTWNDRAPAVLLHLTNPQSRYYGDGNGIMRSADMVKVHNALFGVPQAPVVVATPAPEPPSPPGAKKPAVSAPSADKASPLTREASRAAKTFAENFGLDPEKFAARFAQNKEKTIG